MTCLFTHNVSSRYYLNNRTNYKAFIQVKYCNYSMRSVVEEGEMDEKGGQKDNGENGIRLTRI